MWRNKSKEHDQLGVDQDFEFFRQSRRLKRLNQKERIQKTRERLAVGRNFKDYLTDLEDLERANRSTGKF